MDGQEEVLQLKKVISQLEEELNSTKAELEKTNRKLSKIELKYEKSDLYNEDLRREIDKLNKRLNKYKQTSVGKDKCTQVNYTDLSQSVIVSDNVGNELNELGQGEDSWHQSHMENAELGDQVEEEVTQPMSVAESIKQAAESATQQSGFVYDESYGMYYDYNTGYYYDPKKSLYYDSNSGIYYSFNQSTEEYHFHSQIDISQYSYNEDYRHDNMETDAYDQRTAVDDKHRKRKKDKIKDPSKKKKKKRSKKEEAESPNQNASQSTKLTEVKEVPKNLQKLTDEFDTFVEEFDSDSETDVVDGKPYVETDDSYVGTADSCQGNGVSHSNTSLDEKSLEESDLEEGELSDSSSSCDETSSEDEKVEETSAVHWPPCIRVIVKSSDTLDEGSLFILTCTGATIGRENNMGHTILIPDLNISKMHCAVTYDEENKQYVIKDHASQNGTFVNSVRISEPKVMSGAYPVKHGDIMQVGGTSLLCHIHPGTDTCDDCEPGQIQAQLVAKQQENKEVIILSKDEKEKQRRKELKNIRKKYGLQSAPYENNTKALQNPSYEDKAEVRRKTKGSDNPYQKEDAPASVDRAIARTNVGHKMMEKMGWKSGQSLGKDNAGIKEPIKAKIRSNQQAGLGSSNAFEHSLDNPHLVKKTEKWVKVQQRYNKIQAKGATNTNPSIGINNKPLVKPSGSKVNRSKAMWVKGETVNNTETQDTVAVDKQLKPKITKIKENIFEDVP